MLLDELSRDAWAYALSKAVPGLITLLAVVVFSRVLSNESYGTYALILSIAVLIGTLSSTWIAQAILRFESGRSNEIADPRLDISFGVWISVGIGAGGFLLLVELFRGELLLQPFDKLLVVALTVAIATYNIVFAKLQALIRPRAIFALETYRTTIVLLVGLLLMRLAGPGHEVTLIAVLVSYPGALWIAMLVSKGPRGQRPSWLIPTRTKSALADMFRFGWPLSLWAGCMLLLSASDRYLIQHYFGIASVGPYAAVYDLVVRGFALYAFPITLAAHPRIMAAHNRGEHAEARRLLRNATLKQLLISIPAVCIIVLTQDVVVVQVLQQAKHAVSVVGPLAVGGMTWQLALLVHKPLEIRKATKMMLLIAIVVATVSVILNYLLLPKFGVEAAAYVYAVGGIMYCGLAALAGWKGQKQDQGAANPF